MRFTSRASGPIAIVAILLVGGVATHRSVVRDRQPIPESRALVLSLLGSARPFEGRLFGLEYLPFDPDQEWRPDPRALARVAKDLRQKARAGEKKVLAEIALAEALGGDLDRAILRLEEAAREEGAEAWIWSDLVVFYLGRYQRNGDSTDLLKALDASSRAEDGEEVVSEAVFNQGLVLEKLFMLDPAREAWERGKLESDPQWAAEAQGHLNGLDRFDSGKDRGNRLASFSRAPQTDLEDRAAELVRDFPQAAREHTEGELLGRWAAERRIGQIEKAARHLRMARAIGDILSSRGERMLKDTIAVIDRVDKAGDARRLASLAHHHALYQQGLTAAQAGSCEQSVPQLRQAAKGLDEAESPFARWIWLRIASCAVRQFSYDDARLELIRLLALQDGERYPALQAAIHGSLGFIFGVNQDPAASLAQYRLAHENLGRLGEAESLAVYDALSAEGARTLGDLDLAWRHAWQALQKLPRIDEQRNRYRVLSEAGVLANEMGFPGAALAFMDASLEVGEQGNTITRIAGLRRRAQLSIRIGRIEEAKDSLEEAGRLFSAVTDPSARLAFKGDLLALAGEINVAENPESAIPEISRAIDSYRATSYQDQLLRLLLLRGRAYRAAGRSDLATVDLAEAIAAVEERLSTMSLQEAGGYLAENRPLYDEMAEAQLLLGRSKEALAFVERARLRGADQSFAAGPDQIAKELSEETAILEFAVLGSSCHAWVIRKAGVQALELSITPEALAESVRNFRASLEPDSSLDRVRTIGASLYDAILRPVLPGLGGVRRLVVIPDGVLGGVPFSALWDRKTERFLLEDFSIVVAPSAALHVAAARRARAFASTAPADVLIIGNPAVDRFAWPSLPDLPGAAAESHEIAALYPSADLLTGQAATKEAVLEGMSRHEVIHVAAHALANDLNPGVSVLVLSPSGQSGDIGALYAQEIARRSYPKARLVFLAVCGIWGQSAHSEGVMNLPVPFLSQGVPSVIGTLWRIDDQRTNELSRRVHEELRGGKEPAMALRVAQLEALRRGLRSSEGFSWAAFQAFGS